MNWKKAIKKEFQDILELKLIIRGKKNTSLLLHYKYKKYCLYENEMRRNLRVDCLS